MLLKWGRSQLTIKSFVFTQTSAVPFSSRPSEEQKRGHYSMAASYQHRASLDAELAKQ